MTKTDYYNELLENTYTKVPSSYIVDILLMVQENGRDAQVINVGDNHSVMLLI